MATIAIQSKLITEFFIREEVFSSSQNETKIIVFFMSFCQNQSSTTIL